MKRHIVFFEAVGGSDKGRDGHRKDTVPMMDYLKKLGWSAEVVFFTDEILKDSAKTNEIFEYVKGVADAYVSRVNPGNLKEEKLYFDVLRKLCDSGVIGMPHPDAMIGYGAKDALTKLRNTELVPTDTLAYYDPAEAKRIGVNWVAGEEHDFKANFPKTLAKGERVLKQNRGSTGEGIWRVQLKDQSQYGKVSSVPLDTIVRCTEAVDNHVEEHKLGDFMNFCEKYLTGDNGMLVDMTFLPRIKEGEIRILMLYKDPIYVVHKKPAEGADAFSATLFSGAKYRYDKPEQWNELVSYFLSNLPEIKTKLGNYDLPLIWTADFILDTDENGKDKYVLGEINCSCVGFTSPVEFLDKTARRVANTIINIVEDAQK
ncbi:Cj0069 family protein [Helicobacter bilis]|uniref:Cj0069 family protein n=1 Tax=Helicobacter bilis TaxID=37372 RepID=UPI0026ECB45D|nr:Cj0069 family protein [Helicobacter bilis]MCI7410280.1 Cj0069 family protein [Helicobacter bilis]MDD7296212.1 Cj0069 family protein [Helicobacter bilis]MDY4399323.1 Cj0069 family protein [Helicobacter bilis]